MCQSRPRVAVSGTGRHCHPWFAADGYLAQIAGNWRTGLFASVVGEGPCAADIGAFGVVGVRTEEVAACAGLTVGSTWAAITSLGGAFGDDGVSGQPPRLHHPNSTRDRTWQDWVWSEEDGGSSLLEISWKRKIRSQKDYFLAIVEL